MSKFSSYAVLTALCLLLTTPAEAALVARFSFDDGAFSGTGTAGDPWIANDIQAPATNTTASGNLGGANMAGGQPGYLGDAFRFDGDPNFATTDLGDIESLITLPAGIVPAGADERTFALWFSQTSAVSQSKLFGYGGTNTDLDATTGESFDISLEGGGVRVRNFNGNITYGSGFDFDGADSGWHHLAVRVNAGASTFADVDYFLNGVQLTPQDAGDADLADTLAIVDSSFGIGNTGYVEGAQFGVGFRGFIDDFRIYDNAITNGEITTLASAAPSSSLQLDVNRDSGGISLTRRGSTLNILGYRLLSDSGSLNQSGWTTISGNYDAPANTGNGSVDANDAWTILSSATTSSSLSEAELAGGDGGNLTNNQTINFSQSGNLWAKSANEDVEMELLLADGSIVNAQVFYSGNGGESFALGDLNFVGGVDEADWAIFRANLFSTFAPNGESTYGLGDLDGDGDNDRTDFALFQAAFDAANGPGSFAATIQAVPEPTSVALALWTLTITCLATRTRRFRGGKPMNFSIRRQSWSLLALLVGLAATLPQSHAALVAQYTFDDVNVSGTGTAGDPWTLNDLALPANNAQATGTDGGANIAASQPGAFGQAFSFTRDAAPGGGGQVALADFENLLTIPAGVVPSGNSERTFSLWFNQTGGVGQQKIFGYGDNVADTAFDVGLEVGGIRLRTFGGNIAYGENQFDFDGTDAGWHHLAVRVNSGASTFGDVDVFVDGSLLSVGTVNGDAINDSINTTDSQFGIGTTSIDTGGAIPNGFDGLLDEFRIYDNALTNGEIGALAIPPVLELTLEVHTSTGLAFIKNDTANDIELDFYDIASADGANGSLVPANLNSLEEMGLSGFPGGDGTGNGWETGGGSNEALLGEAYLQGSSVLAAGGAPIGLGAIFDTTDTQDLTFTYGLDGAFLTGNVVYVAGDSGVDEDYDSNGVVTGDDLGVWQQSYGSNNILQNDATQGTVEGVDFLRWQREATAPLSAATAAVPEPSAIVLIVAAMVGVVLFRTRPRMVKVPVRAATFSCCLLAAGSAMADATDDRLYLFGEGGGEGGSAGANVGSGNSFGNTFDNTGPSGAFADLEPMGSPQYINVKATGPNLAVVRPGATGGTELGILFDGSNDYLSGFNLNRPSESVSSTEFMPPGPLDYAGINDRGFQLWVYPDAAGSGSEQDIVMDTNQHGLSITADGTPTWQMTYAGAATDSGIAVDFNQWTHVMVARPPGTGNTSFLYINGEAVASRSAGYSSSDDLLVVGSNSGDTPGTANFFRGVLDSLNMFVIGRSTNGMDWGDFEFAIDNEFAAQNLNGVAGDISGAGGSPDGVLNSTDVAAFVAGWESENLVDGVAIGDLNSYGNGDLNFDGTTDLEDVFLMHQALAALPLGSELSAQLAAGIRAASVPEPATAALLTVSLAASLTYRRSRG